MTNHPSPADGTRESWRIVYWTLAATVVSFALVVINPLTSTAPWITLVLLATIGALATAPRELRYGPWNPIWWASLGFFSMFALHPIAMILSGDLDMPYHGYYDLRPTYTEAMRIAALATLSMALGCLIPLVFKKTSGIANELPRTGGRVVTQKESEYLRIIAFILVILALASYVIHIAKSGAGFSEVAQNGFSRIGGPGSSAYLYLAPLLLSPASILLLLARHGQLRSLTPSAIVIAILVAPMLLTGQRLAAMISLLPYLMVCARLREWKLSKPKLVSIAVLSFILVSAMRDLNAAPGVTLAGEVGKVVASPADAALGLFTGADTEMLDAIALELQVVPSQVPHQPGITVLSTLSAPVPRALWPGKFSPPDVVLDEYLLGVSVGNASVAFSFVGGLYLDSGVFGVVFGCVLVGAGLSFMARSRIVRGRSGIDMALCAVIAPQILVLLRGNLADTGGRALFTVLPIAIARFYINRRTITSNINDSDELPSPASVSIRV